MFDTTRREDWRHLIRVNFHLSCSNCWQVHRNRLTSMLSTQPMKWIVFEGVHSIHFIGWVESILVSRFLWTCQQLEQLRWKLTLMRCLQSSLLVVSNISVELLFNFGVLDDRLCCRDILDCFGISILCISSLCGFYLFFFALLPEHLVKPLHFWVRRWDRNPYRVIAPPTATLNHHACKEPLDQRE
jgi:hypothetical protein